jgi:hypothetical protein
VHKTAWYQGVVVGTPVMEKAQHRTEEKNLEGIKEPRTQRYIFLSPLRFF